MKCVILAAGRGKRMMPLTANTPKPLLKVKGKAIIDHILDSLPDEIDEVIVVVDYLGDQIKKHLGDKVKYAQGSNKGNALSLLAAKKYLDHGRFLLIYGDEVPNSDNVKRCLDKEWSILFFESGGRWIKDGVMVLNTDIFNYLLFDSVDVALMVDMFIRDHKVFIVRANNFIGEINTPKDLERING